MMKDHYPTKEIIVYIPARSEIRGAAVELRGIADRAKILPLQILRAAQFPVRITNDSGLVIKKPASWRCPSRRRIARSHAATARVFAR
jgi:hypothetical protein